MTKEEFEQAYAERSNLTLEQLDQLGLKAVPCDCGDSLCQGWGMVRSEGEETHIGLLFQLSGKREEGADTDALWCQSKQAMADKMPHTVVMPCGESRTFRAEDIINLPVGDIRCPCGDPRHFIVSFIDLRRNL